MKLRQHGSTTPARHKRLARAVPVLTRLSLLIGLGLSPGMSALGTTLSDQVSFSATGLSLWGNAGGTATATYQAVAAWGTFAGGAAARANIGSIADTVLGEYGAAASFESSGLIGVEFSASARGGSMDFSQSFRPVLTMPDSWASKQVFTVSSRDALGAAALLTPKLPSVQASVSGLFNFNAKVSVTGCVIECVGGSFEVGLNPGKFSLINFDSGGSTPLTVFGQPKPIPGLGKELVIGSVNTLLVDTVQNDDCTTVLGGVHCGAQVLRGGWELVSMLPPFYGATNPLRFQGSKYGVSVLTNFLSVNAGPTLDMDFDFASTAPVFTKLVFDKPVQEVVTNANGTQTFIDHADGTVSFALGSDIKLRFAGDAGKLVGRSYYLGDASIKTSLSADPGVSLRNNFGCGYEITVLGYALGGPGVNDCLYKKELDASQSIDIYSASTQINGVRTTTLLQGNQTPIDERWIRGNANYLNGTVLSNRGRGLLATFESGSKTLISGAGSRLDNGDHARALLDHAAWITVENGGRIDNSGGAQIEIDGGAEIRILPSGSLSNDSSSVIFNSGQLLVGGTLSNHGVINNQGTFSAGPSTRMDSAGGLFINRGVMELSGGVAFGSAEAGTFDLQAGGRVEVYGQIGVAAGYRQVNNGDLSVDPESLGLVNISGTLQIGSGGDTGSLVGETWLDKGGVLAFNRGGYQVQASSISGEGSLHQMGPGTVELSAPGLYTGPTDITGGTLVLSSTTRSSQFNIGTSGVLYLAVAGGQRDFTSNTRFTGTGVLRKSGAGLAFWQGSAATFAMGVGGLIDVEGGTLVGGSYGNEDWTGNQAGLRVATGASFNGVEANVRVDALSGGGRIHSGFQGGGAGYKSFTFGVANGSGTFDGVLADSNLADGSIGNFTKAGSGTQTLTGANTFTGVLRIDAGTVRVGDGHTTGSLATRSIVNNGALAFARSDDISFQGVISGTGSFHKQGAGTMRLMGDHSYTGATAVEAGRLVQEGALASSGFSINSGAVLELQVNQGTRTGAVDTQFVGAGTLRKTGAGTARWAQAKARFAMESGGLIDVQGGTLVGGSYANEDWTANKANLNVAAGAFFDGDEANVRVNALSGSGTIKSGYNSSSGYSAFSFGVDNGSGSFAGVLANSESTGNYIKEGSGTQTLTGASTFTGSMTVNGGTLALTGGLNRLPQSATVYISNGATLDLGNGVQSLEALGSSSKPVAGNVSNGYLGTLNGVYLKSGSINVRLLGAGSSDQRRLWIGGDAAATVLLNGTNDMTQSTDHLQVRIGHANTGAAGTVKLGNADALAAATEKVQVFTGTLDLNGVSAVRALGILLEGGAASSLLNNNMVSGASFMNAIGLTTAGTRSKVGGDGLLTLGGVISGAGGLEKVGAGTLVLSGANSFSGGLVITAGRLQLGSGGVLTGAITNNAELAFNRTDDLTYAQLISGSGKLVKQGAGTLTLGAANTYTGKTSVDGGVLRLLAATRSNDFAVASGAVLDLNVLAGTRAYTSDTLFTGAGTLRKTGSGIATWQQTKASFALAAGSLIDVQQGTLVGGSYANEDWTQNKSRLNVAAGAVFDGDEANVRVDALTGGGTIKSGFAGSGYKFFTFGVGNGSGEFSGVLANSESVGSFVKEGTGTQILSGVNTYSGSTRVQAGELTLNGSSRFSAFSVDRDATLGGSGTLGNLVLAGRLAPGNSPGTLSVAVHATFAEGASYLWEMADATGAAGTGYDLLNVGGALFLNASAANPFTIQLKSLLANGNAGLAANFDSLHDHSYTLAYASGGILGFSSAEFLIDGSGFANPLDGGHWSVSASGNSLNLNFTAAVPEPGSYVMLLAGLLVVGSVANRRRDLMRN